MPERTENEVVFNESLFLTFNGVQYPFKKRNIRRTREWLKSVIEKDGSPFEAFTKEKSQKKRIEIMASLGIQTIEELIVDYCDGSLSIEQIEDGSCEELEAAYNQLLELSGFFDLIWGKTRKTQFKA